MSVKVVLHVKGMDCIGCELNVVRTLEDLDGVQKYEKAIIIKAPDPKVGQDVAVAIEKEAMLNHDPDSDGRGMLRRTILCYGC